MEVLVPHGSHGCWSNCSLSCVPHSQTWELYQHLELWGRKVDSCISYWLVVPMVLYIFSCRESAGLLIVIFWLLLLLLFQRLGRKYVCIIILFEKDIVLFFSGCTALIAACWHLPLCHPVLGLLTSSIFSRIWVYLNTARDLSSKTFVVYVAILQVNAPSMRMRSRSLARESTKAFPYVMRMRVVWSFSFGAAHSRRQRLCWTFCYITG